MTHHVTIRSLSASPLLLLYVQVIAAGVELRYDYGWQERELARNMPCNCGAANCRGNMFAPDPETAAATT